MFGLRLLDLGQPRVQVVKPETPSQKLQRCRRSHNLSLTWPQQAAGLATVRATNRRGNCRAWVTSSPGSFVVTNSWFAWVASELHVATGIPMNTATHVSLPPEAVRSTEQPPLELGAAADCSCAVVSPAVDDPVPDVPEFQESGERSPV